MIRTNLPEDVAGAQALASSPVDTGLQAPPSISPDATAALQPTGDEGNDEATLNLPLIPRGGVSASFGDQLKALGYRPSASPDDMHRAIMAGADEAAAKNPNPAAPGAWARNLLAGAQSALSGKSTFTAGGTASDVAAGMQARGSGPGVGMATALAHREDRAKQISDEKLARMNAAAKQQIDMMRVEHLRRAMATDDPESKIQDENIARDKTLVDTITQGGEEGRGGGQIVAAGKTDAERVALIQQHTKDAKTGVDPLSGHWYVDGKKPVPGKTDKYGNPVYEYTYSFVTNPKEQTIGDRDKPEVDKGLIKRFHDANITLDNGDPIVAGTTMSGEAFAHLSTALRKREAAIDAANVVRTKEMNDKEIAENRDALDDFGKAYAIASSAVDRDPKYQESDSRVKAYYHMAQDPKYADRIPYLQNLIFGGAKEADQATQEFTSRHDEEATDQEMARLNLDRTDLIAALNKLSQQVVHQAGPDGKPIMKNGNFVNVPSPIARAAQRRLNSITQAEIDRHEKIVLDAKAKAEAAAKKQAAQMDFNGTADPDATGQSYLAGLDQQARSVIDLIHSGRAPLSNPAYLLGRKPEVLAAVERAYPGEFDASKVDAYKNVYKEFTSTKPGSAGAALNAGGTVLQHLAELKKLNTLQSRNPLSADYKAYNNKLGTVVGELAQFYQLGKTDAQVKHMEESLGGLLNRDTAIDTQFQSMMDKLASFSATWKEAAPSSAYEARMPGISEAGKRILQQMDPTWVSEHPEFAPKGTAQGAASGGSLPGLSVADSQRVVGTMIGKDGREHYVDANHNWLGVVPGSGKANTGGVTGSY